MIAHYVEKKKEKLRKKTITNEDVYLLFLRVFYSSRIGWLIYFLKILKMHACHAKKLNEAFKHHSFII
jgi:hypothetical protein